LANVRYWLTNVDLPEETPALPGMRLLKRVGPVRDGLGSTLYVYELAEDNPASWMTPVIVKAPPAPILTTVLDPRFDVTRAALFDSSANVPAVQMSELPPPLTTITRVTRYDPGRITIRLDQPAPAGSALIVSENYYPGWTATVDGKPTPVGRADYTLIGVALPAGGRVVDLRFGEESFELGKTFTLVALGVTGLLIVGGVATERRRPRG